MWISTDTNYTVLRGDCYYIIRARLKQTRPGRSRKRGYRDSQPNPNSPIRKNIDVATQQKSTDIFAEKGLGAIAPDPNRSFHMEISGALKAKESGMPVEVGIGGFPPKPPRPFSRMIASAFKRERGRNIVRLGWALSTLRALRWISDQSYSCALNNIVPIYGHPGSRPKTKTN